MPARRFGSYSYLRFARRIPIQAVYLPFTAMMELERRAIPSYTRERTLLYPLTFGLLWRAIAVLIELTWIALIALFLGITILTDFLGRAAGRVTGSLTGM